MYTWKALYLWTCWHDLNKCLLLALGTHFCGCTVSLLCCILWSPYCAWPITPHSWNTERTRRSVNSCIVCKCVFTSHFCSISATAFYSAFKVSEWISKNQKRFMSYSLLNLKRNVGADSLVGSALTQDRVPARRPFAIPSPSLSLHFLSILSYHNKKAKIAKNKY